MKLIWTNGCFDGLHRGHLELLKFAKSKGHRLYVGLDTDEKIRLSKGEERPINNLEDRMFAVKACRWVDKVFSYNSNEELRQLIKNIKPDLIVVGSDYQGKEVVGSEYSKEGVRFFPKLLNYSTTNMINRINNAHNS